MLALYKHIKPFYRSIAAATILVFVLILTELWLPTLMAGIVDTGIVNGDTGYIIRMGSLMLLIAAGGTACSVLVSLLASKTAIGFARLLRHLVFEKVESLALHEFNELGAATLITRTTNDIIQLQTVTFMAQRFMISAPVMCVGGIIMAVSLDASLARIYLATLPILGLVIYFIMKHSIPLFRLMQVKLDALNLVVREHLTGIRVIRAFNRSEKEQQRFTLANRDLTGNAIRVNKLMALMMPAMMLIMNMSIIATVWLGAVRVDGGAMQVGALMAFIQYATLIMMSLVMFSFMFIMIPRASASATRILEVLETAASISDPETVLPLPTGPGLLEFREVEFRFPNAEQAALSGISFQARPGSVTAIIGGTGSGKSALVNLILRFYDVNKGCILLDGIDTRRLAQAGLRSLIGYVPQKTVLFSGSIAENIRYGNDVATDDDLRRAADTAQALEFISALPQGFDSAVEQGGANLSGGQRQRLSIARALVRRPRIYIFDDSFSALDFKTDARLRAALKSETAQATMIVVSQRIASVMDADWIIVLDEGRLVAQGRHQELSRTCGVYQEILSSQLSEEELA